jgi:sialic acid synthase SpsE
MRIGAVDTAGRVMVVAEIGNNHEGDFDRALRLIDGAAAAGVDAVKFQTANAALFISPADEERRRRFASYQFSAAQWQALAARAREHRLLFVSTALDLESLRLLTPLVDALKIASGDVTFTPLLDAAAATRRPMIVSSGASTLAEVQAAVTRIREHWRRLNHDGQLAVLHCVSAYPAPPEEAQLSAIGALAAAVNATIGYSDHVLGIDAALAAVALGARIVEKHFTLDQHQSSFRDHQLSADPAEMTLLVRRIRGVERMLGSPAKAIQPSESANRVAIRRSVAAARDLPAGHALAAGDFMWVRPGTGLAPGEEARLIGRRLTRAVPSGALLSEHDVS